MILNIKPLFEDGHDCLQMLIKSYATWFERGYLMMFRDDWVFQFKPQTNALFDKLGERVSGKSPSEFFLLEKYHGIKIIPGKLESLELLNHIKEELQSNQPVIIVADIFHCPWLSYYHVNHSIDHTYLIIGIDDNQEVLYCLDPVQNDLVNKLPFSDFFGTEIIHYGTFNLTNQGESIESWKEIITEVVDRIYKKDETLNIFDTMHEFANEMLNISSEELKDEKTAESLIIKLRGISQGRKNFSKTLEYMAIKTDMKILFEPAQKLNQAGMIWMSIRSMVIKMIYLENRVTILKQIANKIHEVAEYERQIAVNLEKLCQNNGIADSSLLDIIDYQEKKPLTEIVFIDIGEYLNSNAVGSIISEQCQARLSATGGYLIKDGQLEREIWEVEGMKFRFPRLADNTNDNIACDSQIIQCPVENYDTIMFLGCADDKYSEKLVVKFKDGESEEIFIGFTDFWQKPAFGETIAWTGQATIRINNIPFLLSRNVNLFAKSYRLKHHGEIDYIRMPENINTHVFAISLGR